MIRYFFQSLVFGYLTFVFGCGDSSPQGNPGKSAGQKQSAAESSDSEPEANLAVEPAELSEQEQTPSVESIPNQGDSAGGTGVFRGTVTFKGKLPEPQVIQATKDPEFCSAGEGEVYDVVVKDGKLSGAVVEITVRGENLPAFEPPNEGFVIRQKGCLFTPRLLVAYDGAELVVHNDDKVSHNVNSGLWNLLQGPGADPIRQKITFGGNPFTRVTCNIHSWMESWVYVARSPFCVASNVTGSFVIKNIPAGTRIRGTISHATLGKQRFTVDIEAGGTTEKNFEFEAK